MIIHLSADFLPFDRICLPEIHPFIHADHQILFIVNLPVFDAVSERFKTDFRVTDKGFSAVTGFPAVVLFRQCPRQIKMIKRYKGDNLAFQKAVNHFIVKVDTVLIYRAVAVRNDT